MVGVSITLAYTKRLAAGADKSQLYKKIFSRTLKILLLGWFLWLWPSFNFEGMRFVGVLPRIALVFLACAVIFLNTNWKTQTLLAALLLLFYWGILEVVPVPIDEVNRQALETGMVDSASGMIPVDAVAYSDEYLQPSYEPGINITAWFDRQVVPGRFWQRTWDPEGLLSTIPAIVTGLIGMLIGRIIIGMDDTFRKLTTLFFTGFMLYLVGEMWGWVMPFNKNLWTSSYTLWCAGMTTMGLAACMLVIDVLGYTRWTKLGRVYGANAITSYVLAGMLTVIFYNDIFGGYSLNGLFMDGMTSIGFDPRFASLAYAVIYMLIIYIPALILYKKKIFIKV
jgi:predicted acyltransferase